MKLIRLQKRLKISIKFIQKFGLILLAAALFSLFHFSTTASASKEEKEILILFPGQSDLAAYPLTEKGIKSALAAGTEFRIEYFIEYMDRYRNSDQTHYHQLLDLYRHKYSNKKFDLIILFSAPALDWMIAHGDDIFPQTPVVFTAIFREQLKFVQDVISGLDDLVKKNLRLSGQPMDIAALAKQVCKKYNISLGELCSGSRRRVVVEARGSISWIAVRELGCSGADVARFLGVTNSCVTRLVSSGAKPDVDDLISNL